MKISWLGQAGFRLVTDNGTVIMIDPYLSDNVGRTGSFKRINQ